MTRLTQIFAVSALALAAAAAPVLAQNGQPGDMMPSPSSGGQNGADPAYFMPADPHLSQFDQARLQQISGTTDDLSNLGYVKVAALENALVHPFAASTRARLISQSLNSAI
ncbi:hypothetical protein [Thioclava indica]|uniref:DUF4142 domain-containing protein n=1 Tax=Thioclava indica TaxID=1353528 RepID=A0A074KIX7_9RHOB|nr:hypothetical protein [Thioclava indica]KEO61507.1 hypothetical protein DT23_00645 [Thioclava indica]